jgi:hypothetical protein
MTIFLEPTQHLLELKNTYCVLRKETKMVGTDEREFEFETCHEPSNSGTREPWLWMIKNILSVERRSDKFSCKRNKIFWSSTPMTSLIVRM